MSEEKKPTEQPAPSQGQSPRPAARRPPVPKPQPEQVQAAMGQAKSALDQMGIEIDTAVKVLLLAIIYGVLAAVVDKIIDLPTQTLFFAFGWWAAVLNGPTYMFFKGKENLAGLVMSAVAGFIGLLAWWIVAKIISSAYTFADAYNFFKVLLTGVIAGLLGFGWFVVLERLRPLRVKRG
jgi:hypothetical protein